MKNLTTKPRQKPWRNAGSETSTSEEFINSRERPGKNLAVNFFTARDFVEIHKDLVTFSGEVKYSTMKSQADEKMEQAQIAVKIFKNIFGKLETFRNDNELNLWIDLYKSRQDMRHR